MAVEAEACLNISQADAIHQDFSNPSLVHCKALENYSTLNGLRVSPGIMVDQDGVYEMR